LRTAGRLRKFIQRLRNPSSCRKKGIEAATPKQSLLSEYGLVDEPSNLTFVSIVRIRLAVASFARLFKAF
jgi:hypothetical protein